MKSVEIKGLKIPGVKVITYGKYFDSRGYFTETYNLSQLTAIDSSVFPSRNEFVQVNESYSKRGTVRGLHFQWNPAMGKLIRTQYGHMIDVVLDIRKGSPTLGSVLLHDMPQRPDDETTQWIWVPPGFAHGNFFLEESLIEYFCTAEYNPDCEASISPFSDDLDWSLCDPALKKQFDDIISGGLLISDKDRDGITLKQWLGDERSNVFRFEQGLGK